MHDETREQEVLFVYLANEEEGDEERRHGGHQSKNQVLQLRKPLQVAQESKKALDNWIIYPPTPTPLQERGIPISRFQTTSKIH